MSLAVPFSPKYNRGYFVQFHIVTVGAVGKYEQDVSKRKPTFPIDTFVVRLFVIRNSNNILAYL